MHALDYIAKSATQVPGDDVPIPLSSRTRASSAQSASVLSERGSKIKPPHTEGQIKWITTIDCQSEVMCCRFSGDGSIFAVGFANGVVKIFQSDHGTLIYTLTDDDIVKAHLPCTSLQFVAATLGQDQVDLLMATYASGQVKFWHVTSSTCLHTIEEARQTLCSSFNFQGDRLATGGADPQIQIYDTTTKQKVMTLEPSDSHDLMNGHRLRVFSMQYHPLEPHLLLSGGWDDTIQFWDDRQRHAVRRIYGPHLCGDALDIDGAHNHVVTGSWRKNDVLQIWDVVTGSKIKDVPQDALHKCMLYCCQWLGRDYIICGGSDQNMARIIDRGTLNTVAQVFDLDKGVYCIDHDRSSNLPRITIGAAQNLYLFKQEKRT